jgi:hypothetical protein
MRNFWKNNEKKGLENYLRLAIENRTRYCHAFLEIPQVRIVGGNSNAEERILE